jgi:hypothetical protein
MKKVIERLEKAIDHIQGLRLANEDDEKYRSWAIWDISESVTKLSTMDLMKDAKQNRKRGAREMEDYHDR